jgi:hypothetical protein
MTYSLASGDLEDLGWKSDGALHAKLLIFGAVDEVIRDYFIQYMLSVSKTALMTRSKGHEHFSRFLTLLLVRVMRILWSFAVGTGPAASYSFSPLAT